jgi:hypothetical protein
MLPLHFLADALRKRLSVARGVHTQPLRFLADGPDNLIVGSIEDAGILIRIGDR